MGRRRVGRGDWRGAADDWGALLRAEPRDVLALQWALLFDFYRGDAEALRERVAAVLPAWSEADPLYPYVLGHHAFGLEESGRYAEAEAVGRQALAGTARVPWAIHAVAHVMEMQGRHAEGSVWMATWRCSPGTAVARPSHRSARGWTWSRSTAACRSRLRPSRGDSRWSC